MSSPTRIVRSTRVLVEGALRPADVQVAGETILAITAPGEVPEGVPLDDAGDLVVMPGLVDSHVHVNEPGRTAWEGYETATRAAAAGGITTIADMPLNCIPVTTTPEALATKLTALEGKLSVDCAFLGGLIPANAGALDALADAGVAGVKAFMIHSGIDDFPMSDEAVLRQGMETLAARGLPLLAHAELAGPGEEEAPFGPPRDYASFLASRPARWEVDAIALLVRLARETGCAVHVVHLSAAEALPVLEEARAEGLAFSVETCPHYLTLEAEEVPEGATAFKCCPPIRGAANQARLWEALEAGTIDLVVSDHSPCTADLKLLDEGDFEKAWGGIGGLQLGLPVIWSAARTRGLGVPALARWMCEAPARLLGLAGRKGALAPGADADLLVWDPDAAFTPSAKILQHRNKVCPYLGRELTGVVRRTYLRGRLVHEDGAFPTGPAGRPLLHTREDA